MYHICACELMTIWLFVTAVTVMPLLQYLHPIIMSIHTFLFKNSSWFNKILAWLALCVCVYMSVCTDVALGVYVVEG